MTTPQDEVAGLQCGVCTRSFKRKSHLKRHERIHLASRPYACSLCLRAFARRDALRRHEISHRDSPNLLQLGNRACLSCAAAKTRCTGSIPCKRCFDRGSVCVYPDGDRGLSTVHENALPSDETKIPGGVPISDQIDQNVTLLPDPTVSMPNFPIVPTDEMMYDAWNNDFAFATNWIDAPVDPNIELSPHSWDLSINSPWTGSREDDSSPQHDVTAMQPPRTTIIGSEGNLGVLAMGSNANTPSLTQQHDEEAQSELTPASGEFYVDGDAARLPRVRKTHMPLTTSRHKMSSAPIDVYSLHLSSATRMPGLKGVEVSDANYAIIIDLYQRLCRTGPLFGLPFTDCQPPSKDIIGILIALFRERFVSVLPFVHELAFADPNRHYLLDLAFAAIGAQYLGDAIFSASMNEFTRRCLILACEGISSGIEHEFAIYAALLLNFVGLAYSGNAALQQHALRSRAQLKIGFDTLHARICALSAADVSTRTWHTWMQHESSIRLTFSIWLVDTMFVFHGNSIPNFSLATINLPLLCSNNLWRCRSIDEWTVLSSVEPPSATLVETLQDLYLHRRFPERHNEFVRILVIHGLFHRLWDVERYFSAPFSHWEPSSARKAGAAESFPSDPVWLPSIPAFKNWQNSSCDAIDVLHWQANASIGRMRGLEHPTVLHLHFSRIVLLSPYEDILALARGLASADPSSLNQESLNKLSEPVRRWAVHHQYKARLMAIHAGVSFWHLKRHGIDAFYETPSIALAALAMWAFSVFAERSKLPIHNKRQSVRDASAQNDGQNIDSETIRRDYYDDEDTNDVSDADRIILIDRPTDDELVQQYVRAGATMKAHMSGVGDIMSPMAPQHILEQGLKLLQSQDCWGASAEWSSLLSRLKKASRDFTANR